MRITIDLPDTLIREAEKRAAENGVTLGKLIELALQFFLGWRRDRPEYSLHWRTETGRLRPGVDLDSRDSLFDRLDGRR